MFAARFWCTCFQNYLSLSSCTYDRLRDHLREIEEGVPSPLNQSKSFQSHHKSEFHRYSAHDGSVEGSSSEEADLTPSEINSRHCEDRDPVVREIKQERTKYSQITTSSQTHRADLGPSLLPSTPLKVPLAFVSISNDSGLAVGNRVTDISTDVTCKNSHLATFRTHLSDVYMNQDHFDVSDEDISLFDLAK